MSCLIQPSLVIPVGSVWSGLCPWLSSRLAVHELEVQRAQLSENPRPHSLYSFGGGKKALLSPSALWVG